MASSIPEGRNSSVAIVALLACAACGGGAEGVPAAPTAIADSRPIDSSDLEIAQLLYADTQRTPSGFHVDSAPTESGYVATSHLKNVDLPDASNAAPYELCSDDWTTALSWSDQVAAASVASILTDTNTTTSYYEFGRTRPGTPAGYVRARVYRCSYLDRTGVDLNHATGAAGKLNQRPLTATELQLLAEYLWQFTAYNNYGSAVLKSSGTRSNSGLQHSLIIALLTSAATGGCDRISVFDWTHSADAQTGQLDLDTRSLWDFGAHLVAGQVKLCNPF